MIDRTAPHALGYLRYPPNFPETDRAEAVDIDSGTLETWGRIAGTPIDIYVEIEERQSPHLVFWELMDRLDDPDDPADTLVCGSVGDVGTFDEIEEAIKRSLANNWSLITSATDVVHTFARFAEHTSAT